MKKVLLCGATGFIGRNLAEAFLADGGYSMTAVYHRTPPPAELTGNPSLTWIEADLRNPEDVEHVVKGHEIILQAAATTSGAKDIVTKPYYHVTDNAVMNSLIFRQAYEQQVRHVVFFSCTTMYPSGEKPVREEDFTGEIIDRYFGVGWTKVYLEKMCEFYSRISKTRYTVLRHSNIYGPHDKFDLEKSHVFGATVTKVMTASDGQMTVWGDGSDERDLLYVEDLTDFVKRALEVQESPFELVNLGLGSSVSVKELVSKIIRLSGKNVIVTYDTSKPSIGFKLRVDIQKACRVFGWKPRVPLDAGILKTLDWYRRHFPESA